MLFSTTTTKAITIRKLLSPTYKHINRRNQTTAFIRTLVVIAIAVILFFILIILIIIIVIKSQRFRVPSTSSEDKVSSSSFAQSISTGFSTDSPTNINYQQQQKQQQSISTLPPINYENYLRKSTFIHGLVPQTNLSPRFHRPQQTLDEKRRVPLHIRSPSLLRINPFIDHASLTTNEHLTKQRGPLPKVTHLKNGDVIISA